MKCYSNKSFYAVTVNQTSVSLIYEIGRDNVSLSLGSLGGFDFKISGFLPCILAWFCYCSSFGWVGLRLVFFIRMGELFLVGDTL